ncbi:MAG TPA: hypothetical protein VIV40_14050 [Kofleriaceae bacterium]
MRRASWRWLGFALLGACSFQHGVIGDIDGARGSDATAYDACYGSGLFHTCLTAPPPSMFASGSTLDTSTSTACALVAQTDGPTVCLIAAQAIVIDDNVSVIGSYPLVLLGTDTIAVNGAIDVSSHRSSAVVGAGANWSGCNMPTAAGPNTGGAGGGAGGSFGSIGGAGGEGNNTSTPNVGTAGGAAAPQTPMMIRGGCAGDLGAVGLSPTSPGARGDSGGAVYLLAGTSITVNQWIAASGAGGGAGTDDGGGGGGGAGGLIGLEAPTITVTAIVAANGGGGGGGGDGTPSAGGPGDDGSVTTTVAASGGLRTASYDTTGGTGGVSAVAAGAGTSNPAAGGGGGGSTGVIYIKGALTGASYLSPPP